MVSVTIVGASGYTGETLLRNLVNHPLVERIIPVSRTHAGKQVSSIIPELRKIFDEKFISWDYSPMETDLVFFASPPGEWVSSLPDLINSGIRIITLGGKFRIPDPVLDERYYPLGIGGTEELLKRRVYGLPELYREEIKKADFVTNPGCYATSIILSLLPLKNFGHKLELTKIAVDSFSGTTGAGKPPGLPPQLYLSEMKGNIRPYNIGKHRHVPEAEWILRDFFQKKVKIFFTPSVFDADRGIYTSMNVFGEIDFDVWEEYSKFYMDEPFVRMIQAKDEGYTQLSLKNVIGTNFLDLLLLPSEKRILILSVLDNLMKGASGQAIQSMNLMLGFDEKSGLI